MPIAFENPPINEVAIAAYFNPHLNDFRSEHVGLFWEKIKREFPVVRQQPPLVPPLAPATDAVSNEMFPMPRYWFVSEDDTYVIQVEKSAFILNWRRRKSQKYPRFHRDIKPTFDRYYGLFDEFVRTEVNLPRPSIGMCELTYVNTIERCQFWDGPDDTARIIPAFSTPLRDADVAMPSEFNCQYGYRIEADLGVGIAIRSGPATEKPDNPMLVFEIKVGGPLELAAKSVADKWFERAHDHIIDSFVRITDSNIQREHWKLTEEPQ